MKCDSWQLKISIRMFDPEHQNIDCPDCLRQRVYFDREIGYYCMFCGHKLSVEEALLLMERMIPTFEPTHDSDEAAKTPIVEIKEHRTRRSKTEHISQSHDT